MYVDDNFPSGGLLKVGPDKIYTYGCVGVLAAAGALGRSPLLHTSVTSIMFPWNSDTLLFVAAVLEYSMVPIHQPRIRTPTVSAHLGCAAAPMMIIPRSVDIIDRCYLSRGAAPVAGRSVALGMLL